MTDRAAMQPAESASERVGLGRLVVRWVQLIAVVGVVGYSAVVALASYLGESDTVRSESPSSPDAVTGDDGSPNGGTDSGGLAPGDTVSDGSGSDESSDDAASGSAAVTSATEPVPSTEAPSERTGPPSQEEPARVYIVGDSDAGTFGPYLQTLLDGTLIVDTELNYKVSSGLARPDFFNWPAELERTLPEVDPDIVVATFGGNDSQGLSLPQDELEFIVGDPVQNEAEWSAEYQRRVGEVLDIMLAGDREVIWVGIPNDDNPEVTERLRIQDQAVRAAIAERPDVRFVDTWARFSGRDGGWAEFVVDPRDGVGKDVRADDGFHLNTNGAEILALDVAQAVRDALRDLGANI